MNGNNITRFNPKTEKFASFRVNFRVGLDHSYHTLSEQHQRESWFTEYFGDKIPLHNLSGGQDEQSLASTR